MPPSPPSTTMPSRDVSVPPPAVLRTLYRATLRLLAHVERCDTACGGTQRHMTALALQRWAVFVPHDMHVVPSSPHAHTSPLRAVTRRCFAQPTTTARVTRAFAFVKAAAASLPTLELLARWRAALQDGDDGADMVTCLALCGAALQPRPHASPLPQPQSTDAPSLPLSLPPRVACASSASASCARQPHIAHDAMYARQLLHDALAQLSAATHAATTATSRRRVPHAGTPPPRRRGRPRHDGHAARDAAAVLCAVRAATRLRRREAVAEDYSLVSAAREGVCAEQVLNVLLQCVFDAHGVWATSLVGLDTLPFAWLRLSPRCCCIDDVTRATTTTAAAAARSGAALYVSWSYGVHTRAADVARVMRVRDSAWLPRRARGQTTATSATEALQVRRRVCCALLRRQLACLSMSQTAAVVAPPSRHHYDNSDDKDDDEAAQRLSLCQEQLLYLLSV